MAITPLKKVLPLDPDPALKTAKDNIIVRSGHLNPVIEAVNELLDGNANMDNLDLTGTLNVDGISTLGAATPTTVSAAGAVAVANTTDSTTKDTGAIVTEGGIGVEKSIVAGVDITAIGRLSANTGTVADPAVRIGAGQNGFYQISVTQLGVSVADALATLFSTSGIHSDGFFARVALGTPGANTTVLEYSTGRDFTSVITLGPGFTYAVAGAAAEAIGKLIYTLPAGAQICSAASLSVSLQGTGTVDADTPEIGIGSLIASGANATLGAVGATAEDYIAGVAVADCNGTVTNALAVPSPASLPGINVVGGVKLIHLNIADTWAGADTVTATGTVVIRWTLM